MGDSNVYTAERIISKRKYRGVTQYYIKWKGYSLKESTWEPIENIFDPGLIEAFETGRSYKAASASLANTLNYSSSSASASGSRSSANSSSLESQSSPTASSSSSKRSNDNSTSSAAKRGRGRPRKVSYSQQREEQVRIQRNIEQQQLDKARQTTTTGITNNTPSKSITTTNTQAARSESVSRTIAPSAAPEQRAAKSTANSAATNTLNAASNTGDKQHLVIFNPQGRQAEQAVLEQIVYQPELTKSICVTDVTYKDVTVVISESSSAEGFFKT